jgi:hypothetical protein
MKAVRTLAPLVALLAIAVAASPAHAQEHVKDGAKAAVRETEKGLSSTGAVITDGWITTRVQSGMLSEKQRRTAVPTLLDFAEDFSLAPETRTWVFQALRDITGQTLPHDPGAWRNWHGMTDGKWHPVTRDGR